MKGRWEIVSNYFGGKMWYRPARKLRADEPLHGGNVEYGGQYIEDREAVEKAVAELNKGKEE